MVGLAVAARPPRWQFDYSWCTAAGFVGPLSIVVELGSDLSHRNAVEALFSLYFHAAPHVSQNELNEKPCD